MKHFLAFFFALLTAAPSLAAQGSGADLTASPGSASADALRLDLNIPTLRLTVWEDGEVLRSYPVAVGMPGHDTPTGSFEISHAEWNPWWRPPDREWAREDKDTPPGPRNPMGRVKLFFMPLYFIHGTPEAQSIGTPASHGCVRMRNEDVIELARLLHARAEGSVPLAQIERILANPTRTRHSRFAAPVSFQIRYMPVVLEGDELVVYPDVYERNAIDTETVYQALLAAGYDTRGVSRADIEAFLAAAASGNPIFRAPLAKHFPDLRRVAIR